MSFRLMFSSRSGMDPTSSSSFAKASCCSTSRLTAAFFCSSVSPSRLISARCLGRQKVVFGCDVGDVVLASKTELSPSGLSTFSFNFTSTEVTDCTNCSRPSGVLIFQALVTRVSGQNPPGQNPQTKSPQTKSPWTKSP